MNIQQDSGQHHGKADDVENQPYLGPVPGKDSLQHSLPKREQQTYPEKYGQRNDQKRSQ